MNAYEVYVAHRALKAHFTTKYDYFKYNGKIKSNVETFTQLPTVPIYKKVAKQKDAFGILLSNIIADPGIWIGNLDLEIYFDWVKRNQSLFYLFKQQLNKLNENFDLNFKVENGNHPLILKLVLSKQISLETFCILLDITNAHKKINKQLKNDLIWQELYTKYNKYLPFIKYDKRKFVDAIIEQFSQYYNTNNTNNTKGNNT